MTEFRGSKAAIQSIQFILDHLGPFLKLTITWTAISTALVFLYCLIVQPAGPGGSLGANLAVLEAGGSRNIGKLLDTLSTLIGGLVVGVSWTQYLLLEREPRNPLHFSIEMGSYLGRSIQIGLIGVLVMAPGVIAGIALGKVIGGRGAVTAIIVCVALSVVAFIAVYGRLCVVLASAAIGESLRIGEAFEMTKGRTASLAGGMILSYLIPGIAFIVLALLLVLLQRMGFENVKYVAQEITSNLWIYTATCVLAGYVANAYQAFVSGDVGNKIAKTFA